MNYCINISRREANQWCDKRTEGKTDWWSSWVMIALADLTYLSVGFNKNRLRKWIAVIRIDTHAINRVRWPLPLVSSSMTTSPAFRRQHFKPAIASREWSWRLQGAFHIPPALLCGRWLKDHSIWTLIFGKSLNRHHCLVLVFCRDEKS